MYKYVSGNTTFERYNKKYITPDAFNAYKVNLVAILCGVSSAALTYFFMDEYAIFLITDIVLACYFLLMTVVIKNFYTCGLLNSTASPDTLSYSISNFYAVLTQVSFWRVLVSVPLTIVVYGPNVFIHNNLFWIIMLAINCFAFLIFKGVFAREKYYNKTAQKVYSAVLDGPSACAESCDELIASNAVTTIKLTHIENASSEYFKAQNDFFDTARRIKQLVADYEENWRAALIGANYCYSNKIPAKTPMFVRLNSVVAEHRNNAETLNTIVVELNKKPYVDPPRKATYVYVEDTETTHDNDNCYERNNKKYNRNYNSSNSIWDNNVNWY